MKRVDQDKILQTFSADEPSFPGDQELFKKAIMSSPYGYVITTCKQNKNPVAWVNRAFEEITGYQADEAIGRSCHFLLGEDPGQESLIKFKDSILRKERCTEVVRNYRKDGSLFYNKLTVYPAQNQTGDITHIIWTQCDVTPAIEKERNLVTQISEKNKRFAAYMQN